MIKQDTIQMRKILVAITTAVLNVNANLKFREGSASRESMKLHGHVSAVFTPVNEQGELDTRPIPKLAARL